MAFLWNYALRLLKAKQPFISTLLTARLYSDAQIVKKYTAGGNWFPLFLQMVTRTKKIFVGGLSAPSTLEDVKNYFEQFGRVSTLRIF